MSAALTLSALRADAHLPHDQGQMFLTPDDVARLTCRTRYAAQRRALDRLKIRYVVAQNGAPLVREADLDGSHRPARNRHEPRFDLINQ